MFLHLAYLMVSQKNQTSLIPPNMKTNPYLSKEEFRSGVFIGYWTRQVTEDSIVLNDDINLKKYRWDGNLDRQCEKLKNAYEN